jgi:hypothetical protein
VLLVGSQWQALNGGTLDGAHLEVTSTSEAEPKAASVLPTGTTGATPIGATTHDISQEDKPKVSSCLEPLNMFGT